MNQGFKTPKVDVRNFLPGKIADMAMRRWLEDGRLESGGMLELVPQIFVEMTSPEAEGVVRWRNNPREDQKNVLLMVKEAVENLEPILLDKVAPYDYRPEFRVNAPIRIPGLDGEPVDVELVLAVDVATCRAEYEYGLYDLKVTRGGGYMESTLGQLIFYDIAFRAWTGFHPVEHEFWSPLMKQKIWTMNVTTEDRQAMISDIVSCFHGMWRGEDELTDDKNECYNCPVKHACPRFVTPITKDQQGRNRVSFIREK